MSVRYLLDTNICIYIMNQHPQGVFEKFQYIPVGDAAMSVVTSGELAYGAQKSHISKKSFLALDILLESIPALPIPIDAGKYYREIRTKLEKQGNLIGSNDLWIAAHALALDVILVTNNTKEFQRVPKLKLENWVAAIH